jgi:hypothetical protein
LSKSRAVIHLLPESMVDKIKDKAENYDEAEIIKFTKEETDKRLLLLREE